MPWTCQQCGNPVEDGLNACSCGYARIASGVALVADATGKEVQARIPTTFGASSLARLQDPDLKFVSSEQFKLERRADQGGWAVINLPHAKNALFLNGTPIPPEGALLQEGDKLSIKDKCFRLTVRLLA